MSEAGLRGRQEARGGEAGALHGREGILGFGDVAEEYRRLREGPAVLDESERFLLEVRGGQVREHFGGLVTNNLEGASPGEGVYAFVLTARGRPVTDLRALCLQPEEDTGRVLVDVPAAGREGLLEHLDRYLPPRLAERRERDDLVLLGVSGPGAGDLLEGSVRGTLPTGTLSHRPVELAGLERPVRTVRREACRGGGWDLCLRSGEAAGVWERLADAAEEAGGGPVGLRAREILRVERGVPACGREVTAEVLPQETGQEERAISYEKGCYTGQEVVAKIHYRGQVNRRLRGLRLGGGEELPDGGTELHDGERSRGWLTTAVRSPRLGALALAYLHRSVEPGDSVTLADGGEPGARVVELPFEGA